MHVGVLVDAEGKMVADGERRIDFADDVGREMEDVDDPAGQKKSNSNLVR
jgi:hypothetical protein